MIPSHGRSIYGYAPHSAGAEDYLALAAEVDAMRAIDEQHRK